MPPPQRANHSWLIVFTLTVIGVVCMSFFGLKSVGAQEWLKVARSAKVFSEKDAEAASKDVAKLPAALRPRAEALLDELAHTAPSGAAVDAMCKKLPAAIAEFRDPNSAYGGEEPNVATVKQASRAVLHGLLARAGPPPAPRRMPRVRRRRFARGRGLRHLRQGLPV